MSGAFFEGRGYRRRFSSDEWQRTRRTGNRMYSNIFYDADAITFDSNFSLNPSSARRQWVTRGKTMTRILVGVDVAPGTRVRTKLSTFASARCYTSYRWDTSTRAKNFYGRQKRQQVSHGSTGRPAIPSPVRGKDVLWRGCGRSLSPVQIRSDHRSDVGRWYLEFFGVQRSYRGSRWACKRCVLHNDNSKLPAVASSCRGKLRAC